MTPPVRDFGGVPGSKIFFSKKVSKHTQLGSLIILYHYGTTQFVGFGVLLDTKFRLFSYPHFECTFGQENGHPGHRTHREELRLGFMCSRTLFRGVFEGQDPASYGTYWRYEVQQVQFSDFFRFFSKLSSTSLTSTERVKPWFHCS